MNPHVDLRASNNVLHIRTCSDTGRALMQLITYFAGDGDLDAQLQVPSCSDYGGGPSSAHSTPRKQTLVVPEGEQLLSVSDQPPQDISNLSKSQHQHVNDLLGEAMKESLALNAAGNTPENQVTLIINKNVKNSLLNPVTITGLGIVATNRGRCLFLPG